MEFKKRFGERKRSNPKKGLFLIILLAIVLYLFFNADNIIDKLF